MTYGILPAWNEQPSYLSEEIQRGLRLLSKRTGRPQAELIREALDSYLGRDTVARSVPSFVGKFSMAPTDSSSIKQEARLERYDRLKRKYGWDD